ncbi:MAG: tRNA glutamyl-Q(34) synthetase GluQRS [Verrucomicrobia bacterium]|nr:MAG: tRNA glutamyl-Q(34) synthetase GluQRS [Verrucomicrobiota bacterium]
MSSDQTTYRGRLAPSPTGHLHLGHARTFWTAQLRAISQSGTLILRNEDLDHQRCKQEFASAMFDDLKWFGFDWQEGPDCGGRFAPYNQSERMSYYRAALDQLRACGIIYPCTCSRKDIATASRAPHREDDDEPIYAGTCRPKQSRESKVEGCNLSNRAEDPVSFNLQASTRFSWRFRVPDGETISFTDNNLGPQSFVAGKDIGDFVIWRHDDVPAYQLACVVDDAAMQISEVVRGEDLLASTARQILLYSALDLPVPEYFHCPLMTDDAGVRLAKRHEALSLRKLRKQGKTPEVLRCKW